MLDGPICNQIMITSVISSFKFQQYMTNPTLFDDRESTCKLTEEQLFGEDLLNVLLSSD